MTFSSFVHPQHISGDGRLVSSNKAATAAHPDMRDSVTTLSAAYSFN